MTHAASGKPVAYVAIGAMLVGSIVWTAGGKKGTSVKRGDELGYFAYGGSTIVVLFPKGLITYATCPFSRIKDPDLESDLQFRCRLGRELEAAYRDSDEGSRPMLFFTACH